MFLHSLPFKKKSYPGKKDIQCMELPLVLLIAKHIYTYSINNETMNVLSRVSTESWNRSLPLKDGKKGGDRGGWGGVGGGRGGEGAKGGGGERRYFTMSFTSSILPSIRMT